MTSVHATVSSDDEPLILVDAGDEPVGFAAKQSCHQGDGVLHRAFSVFLLNERNDVLLQRRSAQKLLWPRFWSNACCSHPRRGESVPQAVERRLREELGVAAAVTFLFKFRYQAHFGDVGAEHELCHVYAGRLTSSVAPNINEIEAVRWLSAQDLDNELVANAHDYTPWLKLEWQRMRAESGPSLAAMLATV